MPETPVDKTIVITGCSSGFGRVTALQLARSGWHVFATVRREADRESLLVEAANQGCKENLGVLLCDITDGAQIADLAKTISSEVSRLDALLNNAGTAYAGPLELVSPDDLRQQFEINVIAHVAVTQALCHTRYRPLCRQQICPGSYQRCVARRTGPFRCARRANRAEFQHHRHLEYEQGTRR